MRDVSCRPVRSDEDMLTGAPRCSRMLTFRSRSTPDTGRGEVLAVQEGRVVVRPGKAHTHHQGSLLSARWSGPRASRLVTGRGSLASTQDTRAPMGRPPGLCPGRATRGGTYVRSTRSHRRSRRRRPRQLRGLPTLGSDILGGGRTELALPSHPRSHSPKGQNHHHCLQRGDVARAGGPRTTHQCVR